jgi:hypothetical protein
MWFKSLFEKYVRHLRKQPTHAKRVHAFSISAFITFIVAVIYLHFAYGFWNGSFGEPVYSSDIPYQETVLTTDEMRSPYEVLEQFIQEAKERITGTSSQ